MSNTPTLPNPDILRGRMSDDERATIVRLATTMKNPTPGKIARSINRHPATVNWFMLTRGLIDRKPSRAPGVYQRNGLTIHPYAPEHDARLLELRIAQKTFQEIADTITREFGIRRSAHSIQVRNVLLSAVPDDVGAT